MTITSHGQEADRDDLSERLLVRDVVPERHLPGMEEDVRAGLLLPPRVLPPKYFYDEYGARLFEQICTTPEYYPTRIEEALLRRHSKAIIAATRPQHIIELGSGSSRKTRHILDACAALDVASEYWPFDVSADMLLSSARELVAEYPWLSVNALVGDYHGGLGGLPLPRPGTRLFLFLGGTIGNFEQSEAAVLFEDVRSRMRPGDYLLLGADRVKPAHILEAAYADAGGVTAAFNKNVLRVLNHELQSDFDPSLFRHEARFMTSPTRIEMHLRAERDHTVILPTLGEQLDWSAGESMRTEISRKFSETDLRALLALGGLRMRQHIQAPQGYYSLILAGI